MVQSILGLLNIDRYCLTELVRNIFPDALCSLKELSSAVDDILLHRPPDGVTDIDANVNHFLCPEYAWDMIDYLLVCHVPLSYVCSHVADTVMLQIHFV